MAKVDVIQTSFSAGEFGSSLYGRTDIAQYANACAIVENMIPRSYGSLISMPGTRYVATVSDSTLKTRLMKFVFNRTDSYVIEMGAGYMRFYTDRGQVVTPSGTEDLSALTANLMSHYKLNDNTNSTVVIDSKSSRNGTCSTLTSTVSTTGIVNGAFNFAGLYNVQIPDSASFSFSETAGAAPFSMAFWIYYTMNGDYQRVINKWNGTSPEWQLLFYPLGTFQFATFSKTSGTSYAYANTVSPVNEGWRFVVATYDGRGGTDASAGMNVYIDGVNASCTRETTPTYQYMMDGTNPVYISGYYGGVSQVQMIANKLDNVAIFNKELTSTEVASLYTSAVYQISTVFAEDEIDDVHITQLNDVIWLTHQNHPPQKLIRTSANEWTISDAPIIGGPFLDNNTPALTSTSVSAATITITPSATTGTINITVTPTNSSLFTVSGSTLGHHGSYWMIGGLAQTNSTTGLQEVGYVRITYVTNSYTATATVIKNLKAAAATTNWAEGAFSAVRGYPSKVTFHERRLFYARTNHEPQKEWGSATFEYDNFELNTQAEDDGLNLPLASNESNEIQWLASGKSLIAGTFGGAFVTNSRSVDPITPDNANATEETGYGSESIMPKKIGNLLYYIQRFGKKLREMFYEFETDTFKATDKTILSPHVLGDGVIDMDIQQNPENLLYCVLRNGSIALMVREVDQQVTSWSRHTTDGTYTSVAIIPSQSYAYDEAWVIVERWINGTQKKYVEYFENIDLPDRQDQCLYLHSALSYDAYEKTSLTSATISLSASSGSITLTASTGYFTGSMINKRLRAINADGETLGEGVITATASTLSLTLSITTTFNVLSYAAGYWGVSVSSLSGLTHLEAKTLGILADGKVESLTRTVASGAVTLGSNYFVIHAGLSYDQIMQTLPKEAGSVRGTSQGKIQRINEILFKVNRSTQNFQYGQDANNLDYVNLAFTPTVTTLYTGILPPERGDISMRGGYQRGSQVYIKNSNPLPLELTSLIMTVDTQDK